MRRCCCPPGCLIEEDDFNRNNSTDVGPKWFEESGSAGVTSNMLQSTASFLVRTIKQHDSERMVATATIRPPNVSLGTEQTRILVNYLDTSNYLFVQYDSVFAAVGTPIRTDMRFYRRSGGIDSQVGLTRTIDASNVLSTMTPVVCYDGQYLSSLSHREAVQPITNGLRAGLQYVGGQTVRFDDFRWTAMKPGCPNCIDPINCIACPPGTNVSNTMVIDLGAGGWIDGTCTNCDLVTGDVILNGVKTIGTVLCGTLGIQSDCLWTYSDPGSTTPLNPAGAFCSYFKGGTLPCYGRRCISLWYTPLANGSLRWQAYVFLGTTCMTFGTDGVSEALYSFDQNPPSCSFSTLTLTKVFDSHRRFGAFGTEPCSGSLPATVEIRQIT